MKQITIKAINCYANEVHRANEKWWVDLATGEPLKRNTGELLMLITSELSEALEGHRKGLQDDKLPQYPMYHVELIDAYIRLLDTIGHEIKTNGMDADEIYEAKMAFNAVRADHQVENRIKEGGKKY